jgi:hypothetical protein
MTTLQAKHYTLEVASRPPEGWSVIVRYLNSIGGWYLTVRDPSGKSVLGVAADATHRKEARQEAIRLAWQLHSIPNFNPIGCLISRVIS